MLFKSLNITSYAVVGENIIGCSYTHNIKYNSFITYTFYIVIQTCKWIYKTKTFSIDFFQDNKKKKIVTRIDCWIYILLPGDANNIFSCWFN